MTTSKTRPLGGALLALALAPILGAGDARAQAPPDTLTLTAVKDSFLRRGNPDRNEGANPGLRLQASGDNRAVVGFDPAAIDDFLDGNTLTAATLLLTIAEIADNWGPNNDRTVDAHPLAVDFAEGDGQNAGVPGSEATRGSGPGVTWRCAEDAEIANQQTDCDPRWDGGSFGAAAEMPVTHSNGLTGEISWTVTDHVQGGAFAWLIKKTDEGQPGRVSYHSKESAAAAGNPDLAPRLILEGQEVPCPQACVAGLNDLAGQVAGGAPLHFVLCSFDAGRGAGEVDARYFREGTPGPPTPFPSDTVGRATVRLGSCRASFQFPLFPEQTFVDLALSDAEQASCAPLAVDILPEVDETNCDISPP